MLLLLINSRVYLKPDDNVVIKGSVNQTNLITPTVHEVMSTTKVKKCNPESDFPTSTLYSIKQMEQYELTAKMWTECYTEHSGARKQSLNTTVPLKDSEDHV